MDTRNKDISKLFLELNSKFTSNLEQGIKSNDLAQAHEVRARAIQYCGVLIKNTCTQNQHQKLIASYFDEIFSDMVCSIYFSFIGLDNPARIILRRSLELGLVAISYWDNPTAFWGWNEHNEDISFSALEATFTNKGYLKFLEVEGCKNFENVSEIIKLLREQYKNLSNVVHPKPYNFETMNDSKFTFNMTDFQASLLLLSSVQIALIKLLLCRFTNIYSELYKQFPQLDDLLG